MVTITNCTQRLRKDGTPFVVLEITGGVELVESMTTGRYYATVRKCTMPFTGTAEVAKTLIGQQVDGDIVKVIVEPYNYINPRTGDTLRLQHSYAYRPKDSADLVGHTRVQHLQLV